MDFPIINAPMSGTASAELATAVSKSGAFGMIGSNLDPDPSWLKEQIQAVREKTSSPFGVGFISSAPGLEKSIQSALDAKVTAISHSFVDPTDLINQAKGSGVKVKGGVVVDDPLQSSVDGIYAAGDAAEGPDFSGGWMVHAIQPTAAEHGRIAALNMAGRNATYKGSLIMNVLDTAGLISISFGHWQGVKGGEISESLDRRGYRYTRLAFEGDIIVGALMLGRTDHVGVLRGLIQTRAPLGLWKQKLMADPNRVMEAYLACALDLSAA